MITFNMNEDPRTKKVKDFGPFTRRQVFCVFLSLLYAIPITLALPISDVTIKVFTLVIIAAPVAAAGFFEKDGRYLETYVLLILYKKMLSPQRRKKKFEMYASERKTLRQDREKALLKDMKPKEKKAYLEAKKKGIITYSHNAKEKLYR